MVVNVFISAVTTDTLSRKEAVAWVNDTLRSHLTKVEEMSTGAAYCQLTHYLFREGINLKKVKFNPRNEPDILNNWKLLTTAWKNLGVDKPVDVEKMKRGKFQDNMEFLQWFYKFFNANLGEYEEYDAVAARNGEDLPALKGSNGSTTARPAAPVSRPAAVSRPVRPVAAAAVTTPASTTKTVSSTVKTVPAQKSSPNAENLLKEIEVLKASVEEKDSIVDEWVTNAKQMEDERDHYYRMLRKIEDLIVENEEAGSATLDIAAIKHALYNEGVDVDENGGTEEVTAENGEADETETF